jgi:hypothetical protein
LEKRLQSEKKSDNKEITDAEDASIFLKLGHIHLLGQDFAKGDFRFSARDFGLGVNSEFLVGHILALRSSKYRFTEIVAQGSGQQHCGPPLMFSVFGKCPRHPGQRLK